MSSQERLRGGFTARRMPASTLPRFRWPSEARLVPGRCPVPHCGGSLALTLPTVDDRTPGQPCINCGRVVCELVDDGFSRRRARP